MTTAVYRVGMNPGVEGWDELRCVGNDDSGVEGRASRGGLGGTVPANRGNLGVTFVYQMSKDKKSLKLRLTENGDSRETPVAPVTLPSPRSTFRRFLSYPHAGKSQRGVPVSAQLGKEVVTQ